MVTILFVNQMASALNAAVVQEEIETLLQGQLK